MTIANLMNEIVLFLENLKIPVRESTSSDESHPTGAQGAQAGEACPC